MKTPKRFFTLLLLSMVTVAFADEASDAEIIKHLDFYEKLSMFENYEVVASNHAIPSASDAPSPDARKKDESHDHEKH